MKRFFDRKISDERIRGYNAEKIRNWLNNTEEIDLEYYSYALGSKLPTESKHLKNQSIGDVVSFLKSHFSESMDFFVEIQKKVYRSGKWEIVLRGRNLKGEITKLGVLNFKKRQTT